MAIFILLASMANLLVLVQGQTFCPTVPHPDSLSTTYANGAEISSTGMFTSGDVNGTATSISQVIVFAEDMINETRHNLDGTLVAEVYKVGSEASYRHFIFQDQVGLMGFMQFFLHHGTGGVPVNTIFKYGVENRQVIEGMKAGLSKNPSLTFGEYALGFKRTNCKEATQVVSTAVFKIKTPGSAEQAAILRCSLQSLAADSFANDPLMDRFEIFNANADSVVTHATFRTVDAMKAHASRASVSALMTSILEVAEAPYFFVRSRSSDFTQGVADELAALTADTATFGLPVYDGFDRNNSLTEGQANACIPDPSPSPGYHLGPIYAFIPLLALFTV